MNQDKRIADLEVLIKNQFGKCKINRGRESIRIFYGDNRFHEILKSQLPTMTNQSILQLLEN